MGVRRSFVLPAVLLLAVSAWVPGLEPKTVALEPPRPAPGTEQTELTGRLASLIETTFEAELLARGVALTSTPEADLVLSVQFQTAGARLLMLATLTDRRTGRVVGGGAYPGTTDLALVTTIRAAAEQLSEQLIAVQPVVNERPRPPDILQTLVVTSLDEGAQVLVGGELPAGRITGGSLTLPFVPAEIGTSLLLETRREGYYPRRQMVVITDPTMTVALDALEPVIRWEIAGSWSPMRWAGAAVGFRRYVVPRRVYAQSTHQLSTRYRFTAGSRASAVIDSRLALGGYIYAPEEGRLRLGLSTGVGLTISSQVGEETLYTFVDPYFNVVSIELRLQFDRFAPFIQSDMIHYAASDSGFLRPGTVPYASVGVLIPWRP